MIEREIVTREALEEAMKIEYAWIDLWDESQHRHVFSDAFTERMEKVKSIADRVYLSVGRHRISRLAACALIAAILMAMVGCGFAVRQAIINWNEADNKATGTMDIVFDVEDPDGALVDQGFRRPEPPSGFTLTESNQYDQVLTAEYIQEDAGIDYMQHKGVDTAALSIDNDDREFEEVEINGVKGYACDKDSDGYLIWCDGIYLYSLSGNVPMDVLWSMAEDLK